MSLMGAKQMSLIETPPQNRYPIQTYVLEKNDTIIREAIYNELGRGGQVFYLHNRIEDLEIVRSRIEKQVPEARIITAHGRMNKVELENAIQEFVDKNYDVLICTTIIETGIDIPNSNTLLVDMSDRLGLAQMYQIRGRVGRSDRVSYAYFMYDSHTILTEEGEARLKAIKEFTNLGSGYKIAMRDLTIRGAGDFLGKEQSGYIDQIGFDLYIKMLDDCLNEVNNIKTENEQNAFLDEFQVSKHIDNDYTSDDEIKIYIHKQINNIKSKEDKYNVINDIEDRFGKLNSGIKDYIQKQYIDAIARSMGVESIKVNDFKVNVIFNKEASKIINSKTIMKIVFELGEDYSIQYKNNKYIISINRFTNSKKWMYTLEYILFQLFPNKL
jgi:transcription-repair coupling factor (superfamily II helicase)